MVRTKANDCPVQCNHKSQSPQGGAMVRTMTDQYSSYDHLTSQSPQGGAMVRTKKIVVQGIEISEVSIPSRRGNGSD